MTALHTITLFQSPGVRPSLRQVTGLDEKSRLVSKPIQPPLGELHPASEDEHALHFEVAPGLYISGERQANGRLNDMCAAFLVTPAGVQRLTLTQLQSQARALFPNDAQRADLYAAVMRLANARYPLKPAVQTHNGPVELQRELTLVPDITQSAEDNLDQVSQQWWAQFNGRTLRADTADALERAVRAADKKSRTRRTRLAARSSQATQRAAEMRLPPLKGTARQVTWAQALRDSLACSDPADPRLVQETAATYWINNRHALRLTSGAR